MQELFFCMISQYLHYTISSFSYLHELKETLSACVNLTSWSLAVSSGCSRTEGTSRCYKRGQQSTLSCVNKYYSDHLKPQQGKWACFKNMCITINGIVSEFCLKQYFLHLPNWLWADVGCLCGTPNWNSSKNNKYILIRPHNTRLTNELQTKYITSLRSHSQWGASRRTRWGWRSWNWRKTCEEKNICEFNTSKCMTDWLSTETHLIQ